MATQQRTREIRFQVMRDFWNEDWDDYCTDSYPILHGTREEAEAVKSQLEAGSDPSWHDPANGTLSVVQITL